MNAGLRVVLLLLAASLLAGTVTGSALYYRLTYLWSLLLIGSWLMSALSLRGVQVERTTSALRSQVGQVFEERFRIVNQSRVPRLWIEVRDESALPGSRGSHVLTMVGGGEARTYLARTRLTERGVFPLGPTVLGSGDLFGLFPASRAFAHQETLMVYPMMVEVNSFAYPPGLLPGGEALRRRTPQITSNASGVREYNPGDPLNRIHWVSTARRDRMMVKEFELDPLADVWIFVDGAQTVQAALPQPEQSTEMTELWWSKVQYKLPPSTVEYGVSIAASLARYYIRRGRSLGMVSSGGSLQVLPADRGGRQLGKILENLALFTGEGKLQLPSLVEAQARHLPRGSTVVVVTSSASNDVISAVDLLLRRGLRPLAVLLDAATFGGTFSNAELAQTLEMFNVPVVRVAYGDDLAQALSINSSFAI